ncbi:hypothetical protein M432DRAFT_588845 [Thermoascus aurantiacus ATCC 26904]
MANFPALQPAFTIQPMTGGTIKSEPGYSPSFDSEFVGVGNDYIHADPDGKHLRLNAHGVVKTNDGALVYLNYTGTIAVTPAEASVLSGQAESTVTPYGNSFTHITFETGDERYKDLENRVFVGQGHFIVEKGKPTIVEYKVSQVVKG